MITYEEFKETYQKTYTAQGTYLQVKDLAGNSTLLDLTRLTEEEYYRLAVNPEMYVATVNTNTWSYTREMIEALVNEALEKAKNAHDYYDCRDYLDHIEYEEEEQVEPGVHMWNIHVYTRESRDLAGLIATNIARRDTDQWDWFVTRIEKVTE